MGAMDSLWQGLRQPLRIGSQVFAFSLSNLILEFLVPVVIYIVVAMVFWGWIKVFLKTGDAAEKRQIRIRSLVRTALLVLGIFLVVVLGSRFLEIRLLRFFEDAFGFLTSPFYRGGGTEISLLTILLAGPVAYLAHLAGKAVHLAVDKSRLASSLIKDSRRQTVAVIVRYASFFLVLLLGLSIIGFDLSSIGIFLALVLAGILFALQGILANFFAGLGLVMARSVQEGDWVVVSNGQSRVEGLIEQISLMYVVIAGPGSIRQRVPTSMLFNGQLALEGRFGEGIPVVLRFGVAADTDTDLLERTIKTVASKLSWVGDIQECSIIIESITGTVMQVQVSLPFAGGTTIIKARPEFWKELAAACKRSGISFA